VRRKLFQGCKQPCRRLVEPSLDEPAFASSEQIKCRAITRAETPGGLEMLQCEIGLASPYPEDAALVPTDSEAWIKSETAIYQPDRDIEVLPEHSQGYGRTAKDIRVVRRNAKCFSCEVETHKPIFVPVIGPVVEV
jgi:hypothetical protein